MAPPSLTKPSRHRTGGESRGLSLGVPSVILMGLGMRVQSSASYRCLHPYHEKVHPPLFSVWFYTLFSTSPHIYTYLFIALLSSFCLIFSEIINKLLVRFSSLIHWFCCICNQIWHFGYPNLSNLHHIWLKATPYCILCWLHLVYLTYLIVAFISLPNSY